MSIETLEKTYQPDLIEHQWYQHWEKSGFFKPQDHKAPSYCIMLPPPNVTGTLHMGHAFQDTLMDALIRYHRMRGYRTLWQGGTDHAGIATQMVVERKLAEEGKGRHDLGRELFTQKVWEWKQTSGDTICQQMRRLGASVDWSRERFTMDPGLSEAVKTVFVQMHKEGLIYRGKRLVNWDPKLHTAISDLEVHSEEEDGHLWYLRYPLEDGSDHVIVATTRPETMLGDVAVAVHPEDPRYKSMIGKNVILPLCNRPIPVIADETVEIEFGTGCVKITPAHDFNDNEMGKRHQLPLINIFTIDAIINNNAPEAYQGLERFAARKKIIADLEALGLLEKIEPYKVKIPRGDRSGVVVEPYLTDQWFMNMDGLAKAAIAAVKSGDTNFVPENWADNFHQWLDNIQDWCISRQLWWGHQIPAWYDADGNCYVGMTEAEVRAQNSIPADTLLTQDHDVLDTWFSSALWPFSTLGWPEKTADLEAFYPTQVLVTGFDIIFFWVARMIMMGLKLTGKTPFKTVYVHGLILDPEGQKMSKSKGNIIDPIDVIDGISLEALLEKRTNDLMQPKMAEKIADQTRKQYPNGIGKHGTDPLRFTFCALATTSRFIRFDLARVENYRFFCNKLWNATRYVLMQCEGKPVGAGNSEREYTLGDKWILSIWQKTKAEIAEHFTTYRFDLIAQALYEFTWDQFCDWYLELSKPILSNPDVPLQQNATRYTLLHILDELLRTMHPIIPFITEELWQKIVPRDGQSIMLASYPEADTTLIDQRSEAQLTFIKEFIVGIRNIRGEMNINPGQRLAVLYRGDSALGDILKSNEGLIINVAKLSSLTEMKADEVAPESATNVIQGIELFIPLAGLIDHAAEEKRLLKEILKLDKDITLLQTKLDNPSYVNNAPPAVVAKDKELLDSRLSTKSMLETTLQKIRRVASTKE